MCIVKIFWYSYSGSQYFASKIQAMIHLQVPLEFPATLGEGDLWLIKMQTLHKRFINSTASVHLWNSNTFAKIFLLKAYLYFYADLCFPLFSNYYLSSMATHIHHAWLFPFRKAARKTIIIWSKFLSPLS